MLMHALRGLWTLIQVIGGTLTALCFIIPILIFDALMYIFRYLFSSKFKDHCMKTLYVVMALILVVVAYSSTRTVIDSFREAQNQRNSELSCVASKIASGHERIDIRTFNGTCEVTPNGYYK